MRPAERGLALAWTVAAAVFGSASPAGDSDVNETYDPMTDTWRLDLAPMPTKSQHLAAAELDGLLHAVGGRSARMGMTGAIHQVYDPIANVWTSAPPMPTGRSGIGAVMLRGRIYVLGGEAAHTFDTNEAYDALADSWLTFAPLPTPRHGLGVVAVDDAIYVIGGGPQPGGFPSNIFEIFRTM